MVELTRDRRATGGQRRALRKRVELLLQRLEFTPIDAATVRAAVVAGAVDDDLRARLKAHARLLEDVS